MKTDSLKTKETGNGLKYVIVGHLLFFLNVNKTYTISFCMTKVVTCMLNLQMIQDIGVWLPILNGGDGLAQMVIG